MAGRATILCQVREVPLEEHPVRQEIIEALEAGSTTLDLTGNQLSALPPEIARLQNLTTLYLHGNEALSIPPEILGSSRTNVLTSDATPSLDTARQIGIELTAALLASGLGT